MCLSVPLCVGLSVPACVGLSVPLCVGLSLPACVGLSVPAYVGLSVSERTLSSLVKRYSNRQGHVRFNDFVSCFIKLKTMTSK